MAAISQKASPEEVLPLLARNVVVEGFSWQGRVGKPTEYLILLKRYIEQARELVRIAGPSGMIRVSDCSQAQFLLAVLGYRLRQGCGPDASVETAEPERAFVTIDSGFPLTELEDTLRGGKPFAHPFAVSRVPVLFGNKDWIESDNKGNAVGDVLDSLLSDPERARLYWALSRMDATTRTSLRQSPGLEALVPFSAVLDFYGTQISIRSGQVLVPGGAAAESAWRNLVGARPDRPADFTLHLLAKDDGWLAAYYDALSRISRQQQLYFTDSHRLPRFYAALRGKDVSPGPTKAVFRPNPGLLLLVSRLQFDSDGHPHVPGNVRVWAEILRHNDTKIAREWAKRASRWDKPEQLVEALFAFSRVNSEDGPLQVFLAMTEIDRGRSAEQRLTPETVRLLAEKFPRFENQYLVFSEFRDLNNASIDRFLEVAESLDRIRDHVVRADALGIFQADLGLWQILARQGEIPAGSWNQSWRRVTDPFADVRSSPELFDAARASLTELLQAAGAKAGASQDDIITMLAGPNGLSAEGQQVREQLGARMHSILDAQRLISLDIIFALADGLKQMARGKGEPKNLAALAGALREFEMPKPLFTTAEREEWSFGLYSSPHAQIEIGTTLTKLIRSRTSPKQLLEARGLLAPVMRDTLVGLNYAYYEPPGAQMLYNNALFVRSHDFSGEMTTGGAQAWKTPSLFGRGWTASGGAHLVGSLAELPYVLAQVEQNFIVPENVQSLIWEDLVPCLITSSVLPRWWRVTPNELHAVTLYQRFGEELVSAAAENEGLREKVLPILSERLLPQLYAQVEGNLSQRGANQALSTLSPADNFWLAVEFRRSFPDQSTKWGRAGQDLDELSRRYPDEASWTRLSADFGVPHPAFAQTYARELLNVRPLPTFMGYSSRLLAESWESNNLYWARLADEMGYPPAMLHRVVPQLTHRMVENIFATHLEDYPALLRALRETGDEFRNGRIASLARTNATATAQQGLKPDRNP